MTAPLLLRARSVVVHPATRRQSRLLATIVRPAVPQNLVEQIVQRYAVGLPEGHVVQQGDFVSVQPEHVMTHDNTAAVISKFKSIGATRVKNDRQPVFTLDHDVQNKSEKNLQKYASIASFARHHSITHHPAGRGIGHQVMVEEGFARPFTMAVASDSHSNMYGGVGCLGTPVVRTDAAAIWATGRTWWQVPPVARVVLTGGLRGGATGKDVIVVLCGLLNRDEVLNHAIEFTGPGVEFLTIDDRLTIANMTTEWGALAGLFPIDARLIDHYTRLLSPTHPRLNAERLGDTLSNPPAPHQSARYAKTITLDLGSIAPHVSGPDSVKLARPAGALKDVKVHKAYILSCVNSRASDLRAAASILRGQKIAPGVELYVAAASSVVQDDCEKDGTWSALVDAGAKTLPAGCGPCIGLGVGLLKDGEVGISATNRNFKGRMGSRSAQAYLASPAVVAASAVAGRIVAPDGAAAQEGDVRFTVEVEKAEKVVKEEPRGGAGAVEGFPALHTGELLFCDADNLDTDGIYPGDYTYREDVSPEEMAAVAMRNYDPTFAGLVKKGDVLVSGHNFGTGSSREQAATCLLKAGVTCVIAGSLSETFKRNAVNNGLLVLESEELLGALRGRFEGKKKGTRRTGWKVEVDFLRGKVEVKEVEGGERTDVGKVFGIPK
ncbi:mitochondrial Homoaconitase, partial [Irineochytrium annulatum]